MTETMPLSIAIGVAVVLSAVAWTAHWVARAGANGSLMRNATIGIRVPTLTRSDTAWQVGHTAAKRTYLCAALATSPLALLSALATNNVPLYVIAVSASTVCVAGGVSLGAFFAACAAKEIA